MSTLPVCVLPQGNLNGWSVDMFQLQELSQGQALRCVGVELFTRHRLLSEFKVQEDFTCTRLDFLKWLIC